MERILPRGRRLLIIDLILAIWVAGWIWAGVTVDNDVHQLESVTTTISKTGQAVTSIGGALQYLSAVPFVGGEIGHIASQVKSAGQSAVATSGPNRDTVNELAWLLGLAVAVIPCVPVFGIYLPARLLRIRERRVLRRTLLRQQPPNEDILRLLAHRALVNVGYPKLCEISANPWGEVDAGRYRALADAELARIGMSPPRDGKPA